MLLFFDLAVESFLSPWPQWTGGALPTCWAAGRSCRAPGLTGLGWGGAQVVTVSLCYQSSGVLSLPYPQRCTPPARECLSDFLIGNDCRPNLLLWFSPYHLFSNPFFSLYPPAPTSSSPHFLSLTPLLDAFFFTLNVEEETNGSL